MAVEKGQKRKVGILHPGLMGISVAASIQNGGHTVYWVSQGRSENTRHRAEKYKLVDAGNLKDLCKTAEVIISICPPHAAEEMADQIMSYAFQGIYVDANAISPQLTSRIADRLGSAGIAFVDGGIVGVPVRVPGTTWIHLSGERSEEIRKLFDAGPMETNIVGTEPGQASALKMCYAAYNKGNTALVSAVMALSEAMGVRDDLETQWNNHWPGFPEETRNKMRNVTAKAWRFTGEMQEIASTFQHAGLPGGFHQAAEEIYQRMSRFKDAPSKPDIEEVLMALTSGKK